MPIHTGSGQLRPNFLLEELPSTTGQYIGATIADTWERSPTPSIGFMMDEQEAGGGNPALRDIDWMWKSPFLDYDESEPIERMSQEDAQEKVRGLPYELKIPKNGITAPHLDLLMKTKKEEMIRNNLIDMSPKGFVVGSLGFTSMLLTSLADPLNVASAFIPVVGPTRYGAMLAKAGANQMSRAGVRLKVGAIEGAAGAALVEPIVYESAQRQQAEYGVMDSMVAIGFGSIFGGGLHMGAGALADAMGGIRGPATPKPPGTELRGFDSFVDDVDFDDPGVRASMQKALRTSKPMGRIGEPSLVNDKGFVSPTGSLPHRLDGLSDTQRKNLARAALGQVFNDEVVSVDGMLHIMELKTAMHRMKPRSELKFEVAKAEVEDIKTETTRLKAELSKIRFNKFRNELQAKLKAEGLSNAEIHARLKPEAHKAYRKAKGALEKRVARNESFMKNTEQNIKNKENEVNYVKTFKRSALAMEVNKAVHGAELYAGKKKVYHEPKAEAKAAESLSKVDGKPDEVIMEAKLEEVKEKVKAKAKQRGEEYVDLDPETTELHKKIEEEGLVYETFMACIGKGT